MSDRNIVNCNAEDDKRFILDEGTLMKGETWFMLIIFTCYQFLSIMIIYLLFSSKILIIINSCIICYSVPCIVSLLNNLWIISYYKIILTIFYYYYLLITD